MSVFSRRAILSAGVGFLVAPLPNPVAAQTAAPGPFILPALDYGFDANEPHIDAQTMMIHHDRHHAAYVATLNAALKDHGQLADLKLGSLLGRLDSMPDSIRMVIRNTAGGHANHSMFWQIMGGKGGAPGGVLAAAIDRDLGGLVAMQTAFNRAGIGQFGSGWVFITVTRQGKLGLAARPNQDTPLMEGVSVLMGNDVWEHAYYLKYQNRRADYLAAWWNVLDWTKISARYGAAMDGTLTI